MKEKYYFNFKVEVIKYLFVLGMILIYFLLECVFDFVIWIFSLYLIVLFVLMLFIMSFGFCNVFVDFLYFKLWILMFINCLLWYFCYFMYFMVWLKYIIFFILIVFFLFIMGW